MEEKGREEEMDSLFEGMVLFNPSQLAVQQEEEAEKEEEEEEEEDDDDDDEDPITKPPPTPNPIDDGPTTNNSNSNSYNSDSRITTRTSSEPLDENLFSDLTLVTPDQSNSSSTAFDENENTSLSTLSRQISRKKKRAPLRIGYGRQISLADADADADADSLSLQSDNTLPSHSDADAFSTDPTSEERGKSTNKDDDDDHVSEQIQQEPAEIIDVDKDDNDEKATSAFSESNLEHIKAQISEKLNRARELVGSVSAARKDSIRRTRKASENLNKASIRHRDLEKELEEACEAEDFERAEQVSHSLAAAELDKQTCLIAFRDAEALSDAIHSDMQQALHAQIDAEQQCVSLLHHFATDADNTADLVLKTAQELSSKEMDEWLSSTEALEIKKIELEIESHLINEARVVLNNSIDESIEDDKRKKELLCKKKDMLTGELEKLLELVKQKEREIAENDSNIKAVEKRISDVVSGFQETQSNFDAKYDNVQSNLSQMGLDGEALSMKKQEIDEFFTQEEEKGTRLRELARVSTEEAKTYQEVVGLRKSLMSSILKSREDKVRLVKTEEKLSEDVQLLQQEVSAARASLQELSSKKSSIQQDMASFKQRILFITKRVPELEAEKKVAAAARNFKEAARIAAEAKSLSVEKEGIQIDMEKAILELDKLEEEIKETVNRLQETEELILSKEKEVAIARFQRLLLVAGAATAERDAALELGDLEEANLLHAEAEAADSEAKKLQPIYNFKVEEFSNLPKHFISMELVSNLGKHQLAELAAAVSPSPL